MVFTVDLVSYTEVSGCGVDGIYVLGEIDLTDFSFLNSPRMREFLNCTPA